MAFELMQKTLDLVFPTICLHCSAQTDKHLFCSDCLAHLTLLEKEELLPYRHLSDQIAIAFAKIGVAESLFLNLKKGLKPLVKTAASYMVCQLEKENIKDADVIVPLPSLNNNYRLNESLALAMGKMFKRPIKRLFIPLPVAFFGAAWAIRKSNLKNKKVLLVTAEFDQNIAKEAILDLKKQGFQNIQLTAFCV